MDGLMQRRADCHWKTRLDSLVSWLNSYCRVIDVSVQHQPHTTALVWGVIRFAIQVVVEKQKTYADIDTALDLFTQQVGQYRDLLDLYSHEERIHDSVSRIYAWILKYTLLASSFISQRGAGRFWKATISHPGQKLREIHDSISREQKVLEDWRKLAFDSRFRRDREKLALTMHQSQREARVNEIRQRLAISLKAGEAIPEPEEGTCTWILQNEVYRRWRRFPAPGCLVIHGTLGSGKSVMLKFLMSVFGRGCVITYSFRDSASGGGLSLGETFALWMLRQVLGHQDIIENRKLNQQISRLSRITAGRNSSCQTLLDELLSVLNQILVLLPSVTLLVDALDECGDLLQKDRPLTKFFLECGARLGCRVILFSRNGLALSKTLSSTYLITMDQKAIGPDIERFITKQIKNPDLRNMILKNVLQNSEGMFLWARLSVSRITPGVTPRICQQLMENLPEKLFEHYEHFLAQSAADFCKQEYDLRYNIFRLLVAAQENLTIAQMSTALALSVKTQKIDDDDRLIDPESGIPRFCGPLIHIASDSKIYFIHSTVERFLLSDWNPYPQNNTKDCVRVSRNDCHDILAGKALAALTQDRYKSWQYSAHLLGKHLLPTGAPDSSECRLANDDDDKEFYKYACLHWYEHVAELARPTAVVVRLLGEFLGGNAFVSWSETIFDLDEAESPARQIAVRATLQEWHRTTLDPELRPRVPLDGYFLSAHVGLKDELFDQKIEGPLPYLPLVRLGDFYNAGGENMEEWERGYQFTKEVADGYQKILGRRNRLTLTARQKCYQEYLWQMRMDEAEEGLKEVAALQHEVVGEKKPDYFTTLYYLGAVEFHLNKFEHACKTLEASATGLQGLLGDLSLTAFQAKLFHGYALEAQGSLTHAGSIYEDIWNRWAEAKSDLSGFCLMAETARGSVYRKEGDFDRAKSSFEHSWIQRKRLFTIDNNVTVDSGIQLAILYRDSGDPAKAIEILDQVSDSMIFPQDFERSCQIDHIRARIDLDNGKYEAARQRLLDRLHQAGDNDREPNNRELLWMRLTLADAMRAHGEGQDALMLFMNLVKPLSPGELDDEPEPPWRLKVAEAALRHLRLSERKAAAQLLQHHHLEWQRPRDFWILQGGPISDTSRMAPIRNSASVSSPSITILTSEPP